MGELPLAAGAVVIWIIWFLCTYLLPIYSYSKEGELGLAQSYFTIGILQIVEIWILLYMFYKLYINEQRYIWDKSSERMRRQKYLIKQEGITKGKLSNLLPREGRELEGLIGRCCMQKGTVFTGVFYGLVFIILEVHSGYNMTYYAFTSRDEEILAMYLYLFLFVVIFTFVLIPILFIRGSNPHKQLLLSLFITFTYFLINNYYSTLTATIYTKVWEYLVVAMPSYMVYGVILTYVLHRSPTVFKFLLIITTLGFCIPFWYIYPLCYINQFSLIKQHIVLIIAWYIILYIYNLGQP